MSFANSAFALIALATSVAVSTPASRAQTSSPAPAPTPDTVLAIMRKVADWQIAHPRGDTSANPRGASIQPTGWVQAAGYTGIMALASLTDDARYFDAMRKIGDAAGWQLLPRTYDADDHCVAQTYLELFLKFRDPKMLAPAKERFDYILANPAAGTLVFDAKTNPGSRNRWSWCDSLFMGPPAWMRLYAATGNRVYRDFVVKNWWLTSEHLYDAAEHLYFRDDTFIGTPEKPRLEANGKKIFWSRGNGWVMGGLARVLQFMRDNDPVRPRFEQQFQEMSAAILAAQQPDGLWRASLLDPASYPLKETSGSGFYCYAFAWGVNNGLLDRATYAPAALKCWQALVDCVTPDGKLTHVQPIGSDPKKFASDSTEAYGAGAFLLAGSEIYKLLGGAAK